VPGIPIYGMDPIILSREARFDMESGSQAIMPVTWQGSTVLEYQFRFELVAGIEVANRDELFKHMKTAQALVAHTISPGGGVAGPAAARLFLGKFLNTRGVVKSCTVEGKGPYDINLQPTSCVFTGVFAVVPGYNAILAQVEQNRNTLSASAVLERFYSV